MLRKSIATLSTAVAIFILTTGNVFAADLVDTATASGSFKTFVSAIREAGLTETLKGQGPYTVFAPTDAAFAKLPASTWGELMKDKVKLAQVLSLHIVPGKIMVSNVKPGPIRTVEGTFLTMASDNGKITVDNAKVIESDVVADNGVIQAIDAVLLPK